MRAYIVLSSQFFYKNSRDRWECIVRKYVRMCKSYLLLMRLFCVIKKKLWKKQCFQKEIEFKFKSKILKISNGDKVSWKFLIFKGKREIPWKFQVSLGSKHPEFYY